MFSKSLFYLGSLKKIKLSFFSPYNVFYSLNPFPNKPWFLSVCITSLLKTLWEKENLLVMSNFSFSHSIFYPFYSMLSGFYIKFKIVVCKPFQFGRVQNLLFGKGLTLSSIYTHLNTLKKKALVKHCGKKWNCAICILKFFNSHISVVVCSSFQFGMVSKWCIREWVNFLPQNPDSQQP